MKFTRKLTVSERVDAGNIDFYKPKTFIGHLFERRDYGVYGGNES